jgi:hypothetical protein
MKATLEFNLPEDQAEYDMAINAPKFYKIIWDMKQELRSKVKYAQLSEEQYKAYDSMQEFFNNLIFQEDAGGQF